MKSVRWFGRSRCCWCQDFGTVPHFPVFKCINWSAKDIFWRQAFRQTGTGWTSAKTARKVAILGAKSEREKEGEREAEGELRKEKKARLGTAQSNQLLLSAFSAWASGKKIVLGYRKTQNFLVFKLRSFFKSLGLFESVGTFNDVWSPVFREIKAFFKMKLPQCPCIWEILYLIFCMYDYTMRDRINIEDGKANF